MLYNHTNLANHHLYIGFLEPEGVPDILHGFLHVAVLDIGLYAIYHSLNVLSPRHIGYTKQQCQQ